MTKFDAFKKAYDYYPSQDSEGWVPDRGSFKAGFMEGTARKRLENKEVS